jgi:hypothetical protein
MKKRTYRYFSNLINLEVLELMGNLKILKNG